MGIRRYHLGKHAFVRPRPLASDSPFPYYLPMIWLGILGISIGLAMDAFAASLSYGCSRSTMRSGERTLVPALFGGFQAVLPIVGYFLGATLRPAVASFGQWLAFGLLIAVASHMAYEYFTRDPFCEDIDDFSLRRVLFLSFATSIDAFAAGIGLSLLDFPLLATVAAIGLVTFLLCSAGIRLGKHFNELLGPRMELVGAAMLVVIAFGTVFDLVG